jgi:hypothetical protein
VTTPEGGGLAACADLDEIDDDLHGDFVMEAAPFVGAVENAPAEYVYEAPK